MNSTYMKRFIFTLLAVVVLALPAVPAYAARTETIAAVVNNDAITANDLEERMRLIMVSSGMPDTPEVIEKLTGQVLNMLVDEQLMLQEAARLKITVSQEDVDKGFTTIAEQNNMNLQQFREVMRRSGVSPRAMEHQIKAQMAWGKVVQQKLRPTVSITDLEVDSMMEHLRQSVGKNEYLIGEIFLPVDNPSDEGNVSQLARKLTQEMLQGKAPFPRVAGQFSQSASSKRGGDVGWMQEGQMAPEVEEVIQRMNEGDLSEPIKTLSGYYIVTLRKKRVISEESIPSRDEIFYRMGSERLERAQRSHLLNLKSEAFIERRV